MASAFCDIPAVVNAPPVAHGRRKQSCNTTTVSEALLWNFNVPQLPKPTNLTVAHSTFRDAFQGLQKADSWHFHAPSHRGTANRGTYNIIANAEPQGSEINTSHNAAIAVGLIGGKKKFEAPEKSASPRRRPAVHRGCANQDTYDVIANKEAPGTEVNTSHNAAIAAGLIGGKKKFEAPSKAASFRYRKNANRCGVANKDTYNVIANKEAGGSSAAINTSKNAALAAGLIGGKKRVEGPQRAASWRFTKPARLGAQNKETYDVILNRENSTVLKSRAAAKAAGMIGGRKYIDPTVAAC